MSWYLSRRDFLKRIAAGATAATLPTHLLRTSIPEGPIIVDGHLDLGWNMVGFGRDYTRSAYELRRAAAGTAVERLAGRAMLGLPEWLRGRVALIFGAIFVMPRQLAGAGLQAATYQTAQEAHEWGWRMLEAIESLAGRNEHIRLVRNLGELETVLTSWAPGASEAGRQVGILIAMEGADPIRTPDELALWYARGLRCIGLAWGQTRYAGGNFEPGGLSEAGARLLREMQQTGIIFDTAHLAERAFWEALELWEGPLVYTHGIARRFLPTERALSDTQIRAIAARGGVMGIGLYAGFWRRHRSDPAGLVIIDVANAIDYTCQLLGTCAHIAIGSDLDGGFGAEAAPAGIDTIADLQLIPHELRARGYDEAAIDAIMHGNWLRILRGALPA